MNDLDKENSNSDLRKAKTIDQCNQEFRNKGLSNAKIAEINLAVDNLIDIVLDKYFENFI